MNPKEVAGNQAAQYVLDGMIVGLGSGSTAECAIRALGRRVAEGLSIQAVPSSQASARLAGELGIELISLEDEPVLDLTIDGADEVDPRLDLLKGLGGALCREKIVAASSARLLIVVDPAKLVDGLGRRAPLPVEVIPFGWPLAQRLLMEQWDVQTSLRMQSSQEEPFLTDNGNFILDCLFPGGIADPADLDQQVKLIPGVVEHGLFLGLTDLVIVGQEDGTCRLLERS
jgi:ribose 5-phosphate isomerase A